MSITQSSPWLTQVHMDAMDADFVNNNNDDDNDNKMNNNDDNNNNSNKK